MFPMEADRSDAETHRQTLSRAWGAPKEEGTILGAGGVEDTTERSKELIK